MNTFNAVLREAKFMVRDRAVLVWMLVVFCLSSVAVYSGMSAVRHQNATIEYLLEADREDRLAQVPRLKDWGSAAYYTFHFTYERPSDFAFAAMGQRDSLPWKHRIRMLALEGQIYERDAGNPLLAMIGRLDFAFLAAFILPLVIIILLYDVRAGERSAGRHDLLVAIAGRALSFWLIRALLRSMAIFLCLIIPLVFAGVLAGTLASTLIWASMLILAYTLFWTLVCHWFAAWHRPAPVILVSLLGVWLLLAVVVPAGGRLSIDRSVEIPSGADILMTQRETVNDAWDLPKAVTMDAFVERHPEWSGKVKIEHSFEWKWYYAFQQVGDQQTEALTLAYQQGRLQRDSLADTVSLLAPPSLLERSLQALAKTDLNAAIAYEARVRGFHTQLREFFYPKLFGDESFDVSELQNMPIFGDET